MRKIALFLTAFFTTFAAAQQPQTSNAPISQINAKYVQGVGPGYWPQPGTGLTLNLSAGTAFCSGSMAQYAGGSLTMAPSTTNYVYLNTAASCVPAVKSTPFTTSDIPIATVTSSSNSLGIIRDDRTMFQHGASGGSSGGGGSCILPTSAGTPFVPSAVLATISSMTLNGNTGVVNVSTAAAHGLTDGQQIHLINVPDHPIGTISTFSLTNGTVTVHTTAPHGLINPGNLVELVNITGLTNSTYNGVYSVASVEDATTFTSVDYSRSNSGTLTGGSVGTFWSGLNTDTYTVTVTGLGTFNIDIPSGPNSFVTQTWNGGTVMSLEVPGTGYVMLNDGSGCANTLIDYGITTPWTITIPTNLTVNAGTDPDGGAGVISLSITDSGNAYGSLGIDNNSLNLTYATNITDRQPEGEYNNFTQISMLFSVGIEAWSDQGNGTGNISFSADGTDDKNPGGALGGEWYESSTGPASMLSSNFYLDRTGFIAMQTLLGHDGECLTIGTVSGKHGAIIPSGTTCGSGGGGGSTDAVVTNPTVSQMITQPSGTLFGVNSANGNILLTAGNSGITTSKIILASDTDIDLNSSQGPIAFDVADGGTDKGFFKIDTDGSLHLESIGGGTYINAGDSSTVQSMFLTADNTLYIQSGANNNDASQFDGGINITARHGFNVEEVDGYGMNFHEHAGCCGITFQANTGFMISTDGTNNLSNDFGLQIRNTQSPDNTAAPHPGDWGINIMDDSGDGIYIDEEGTGQISLAANIINISTPTPANFMANGSEICTAATGCAKISATGASGTFWGVQGGIQGWYTPGTGGSNTVFRCATAGTLPVGALTINAASCGTTVDTGYVAQ